MKEITDKDFSSMFLVAALYNFIAAFVMLALPEISIRMELGENAVQAILNNYYAYTFYNFTWLFVFIFGIGYYIVSRDVNKNHGIVVTGIIGKVLFYVYFAIAYFMSNCTILMLMSVSGDLLFSGLFAYFLYKKRK